MVIIGDLFLYMTTSLVFSITCLCILLQVRAKDRFSGRFLTILVPLVFQMGLTAIMTYLSRVLSRSVLSGESYSTMCLFASFLSIMLTSLLLFTLSRYLIDLLPEDAKKKRIGHRIVNVTVLLFLLGSLFLVFTSSRGNWIRAMNLTFGYHFLCGSFLMVAHGIASLYYVRKAKTREEESILRGIVITFLPQLVTFPLDMIFLSGHSFKLAYISFSILVVYLYFFISRHYFQTYETEHDTVEITEGFLRQHDLSAREKELARLLIDGQTNFDIGEKLFISVNTVKSHIKSIYKKLNVKNRVQLIHLIRTEERKEPRRTNGAAVQNGFSVGTR